MSSELVAIWITAAATALTAFAVFFVEYSRRRYERKQTHFKEIKEFVLKHINGLLVDYYLPILEGEQGILEIRSEPIYSQKTTATRTPITDWKPFLAIASPRFSLAITVGGHIELQKYEETYPHLYPDAKENHFPELLEGWESFKNGFEALGRQSATLGEQLARKLEDQIKLPPLAGLSRPGSWVNYFGLSNFIYKRLWGAPTGTLNVYEQLGNWVLQEWSENYGHGTKEQMEYCRAVVDELLISEKESVQLLQEQARRLLPQTNTIKQELQQLLLKTDLPGRCEYI
jgi:hypothetical protein